MEGERKSMEFSRREFASVLPGLALAQAQTGGGNKEPMKTMVFRFEELAVRESGPTRIYQVFNGATHSGFMVDMHETELAPGQAPHAAHSHVHEELFLIREGTVELTIAGKKTVLGPGSGVYVASNDDHGIRNAGTAPAKYFVLALGQD
jgi:quercetin dioxygenase-like cupin family protein